MKPLGNKKINPEWISLFPAEHIFSQKVITLGFVVYFVKESGKIIFPFIEQVNSPPELRIIAKAWKQLHSADPKDNGGGQSANEVIDAYGEVDADIPTPYNQAIRHIRMDSTGTQFFVLLKRNQKFPVYTFHQKLTIHQIRSGNVPIHASGVVRKNHLFLFGGPSGIGKSTISFYSSNCDAEVLDEDQLIIKKIQGGYSANAWGYGLSESSIPIKAVFRLVQSTKDNLVRLGKPETCRFLNLQVLDATGQELPKEIVKKIFTLASEITRTVPGYELHFRKSPDFWKLIDVELGLD